MAIFKKIKNRFWRIALIVTGILIILFALVIAFISPIAKRILIETSEKSLNREVSIGLFYFNPFTGHIYAHHLLINERESQDTFISASSVSCNVCVRDFFKKTLNASSLKLDEVRLNIIQDSTVVNFQDLMKIDSTNTQPFHYCIKNISITNSVVHYHERTIPVIYYVKDVNIKCPLLEWNMDTMYYEYDFKSGTGSGAVKGTYNMNVKDKDYDLRIAVSHFDLRPMEQYMEDFASYGKFSAFLDANIHTVGNMNNQLDMMTKGNMALTDFHFGKQSGDDFLYFRKFSMNIDSLSPANKKYFFSAVILDSPFVKYEKYDYLDNFTRLVGPNGANIHEARVEHANVNIIFLISDYVKDLALNIVNSQYHLDQLDITNAHLLYKDYSLLETFSLTADPIKITARHMSTLDQRMTFAIQAKLYPFGNLNINIDLDAKSLSDIHLKYDFDNLPLPLFNPFMVTSTAHPFHNGTLELHGDWKIANKQVNGDNHLLIINPVLADKVKNEGATRIPMSVVMWFIRNWHRTVDIEIPITGDLKNPTYHFGDVILDALKNLFVKPPIFPYTQQIVKEKKKKEKFVTMEWNPMQSVLNDDQEDQLHKIAKYLSSHSDSKLIITPVYYENLEKESILFYEAKKKFYLNLYHRKLNEFTEDDSIAITELSIKDSAFVHYLDRLVNKDGFEYTVQRKCWKLMGEGKVNKEYNELIAMRKKQIMDYFTDRKVDDRVTFIHGESTIPASGFSHYDFDYSGEEPKVLTEK